MLTRGEFHILEALAENKEDTISRNNINPALIQEQEESIEKLKIKKFITLNNLGAITITEAGYEALEPYRVKRAIFIAAGLGSRLRPYTNETPKPLIKVNGKAMIETMIDAVLEAGIEEIIVVRGYLKEKFDILKEKYPNIKFIDNDYFDKYNNIYSAYLVREHLKSTYILDGDLVLYNKGLIKKYQYKSNYIGKYKAYTDDWCLEVEDGRITRMKLGGENCFHMYGVSYWDEKCGTDLARDIEKVIDKEESRNIYWDDVAVNLFQRDVEVRACEENDIVEIDTVEELEAILGIS